MKAVTFACWKEKAISELLFPSVSKTSSGAQPFKWKWVWFARQWTCKKISFPRERFYTKTRFKTEVKATRKWSTGFTSLRYAIGLKNSRQFFIQSEIKLKSIGTHSYSFSRAFRQVHVFTSSLDWFTVLSEFFVIG